MSKTLRTLPPEQYALEYHKRDRQGLRALPRIIRRAPYPGDIHALDPAFVRDILRAVPLAYLYGLKVVELRARQGKVGSPYGFYRVRDKGIVLYSCPPRQWSFSAKQWPDHEGLLNRGATLLPSEDGESRVTIEWSDREELEMFYVHVLMHELGHHYAYQYRSTRPLPKTNRKHEVVAELHTRKITKSIFRRLAAKQRQSDP